MFWEEIKLLFTEMQAIVVVLFVAGIVLIVLEMLQPGFGVSGISGIVLFCVGILIRMLKGGTATMLIGMLAMLGIIITILIVVVIILIRTGLIKRMEIFRIDSALPTTQTQGTPDYNALVGQTGVTINALRPVGKAMLNDEVYDVIAVQGFIEQDAQIRVTKVEGFNIFVVAD